jgi:PadR family transcriptional regulator PadR
MDIDNWLTQLRKGLAEFVLLSVVSKGETYGYEMMQQLKEVESLALGESTVYPLLNRLTKEGHLVVRIAPSVQGPVRRYYRITPEGKIRLKTMESYWQALIQSLEILNKKSHK